MKLKGYITIKSDVTIKQLLEGLENKLTLNGIDYGITELHFTKQGGIEVNLIEK